MVEMPKVFRAGLEVTRDLSGGVRVKISDRVVLISPDQAVKFGAAILRAAGVEVNFDTPVKGIIQPGSEFSAKAN